MWSACKLGMVGGGVIFMLLFFYVSEYSEHFGGFFAFFSGKKRIFFTDGSDWLCLWRVVLLLGRMKDLLRLFKFCHSVYI